MSYHTFPILINSSNLVPNSVNKYRYELPTGTAISLKAGSEIVVQSCSLYNSVDNIRADWGNNTMILFYDNFNLTNISNLGFSVGTTYTDPYYSNIVINKKYVKITIPDGFYDIPDLSLFLKQQCTVLGFYLSSTINSTDMHFFDFQINKNLYSGQINLYPIPSTLANYANPSNTFTLPTSPQTAFIYFPNGNPFVKYGGIGSIFGVNGGSCFPYFPSVSPTGSPVATQHLSTKCPVVQPITNYLFTSNLIMSKYSNPPNMLFQMPVSVGFGEMMIYRDNPIFMSCIEGTVNHIEIELHDQYCNKLMLNDTEFCLTLIMKLPKEQPKQKNLM